LQPSAAARPQRDITTSRNAVVSTEARVRKQRVLSSTRTHSKLKATYRAAYGSSKGLP
jgi:hypothetical protein